MSFRRFRASLSSNRLRRRPMAIELLEDRSVPATWDGGGDQINLNDPLNWDNDLAPNSGDTLTFSGAAPGALMNNTTAGNAYNLVFTASGYSISGNSISLSAPGTTDILDSVGGNSISAPLTVASDTAVDIQAGTFSINGSISGTGNFDKNGAGTLVFNAANTYSGATNVNVGTLKLGVTAPTLVNPSFETRGASVGGLTDTYQVSGWTGGTYIGGTASSYGPTPTAFPNGTSVMIANRATGDFSQSITFPSAGDFTLSFSVNGRNCCAGTNANPYRVLLDGNLVGAATTTPAINTWTASTRTLTGVSAGTHTLTFDLLGDGANDVTSFFDNVQIVPTTAASFIPDASAVTVALNATLDLNGNSETIGSLAGAGTVTSTFANLLNVALTTGGTNASTVYTGVINNGTGIVGLTKTGAGTMTLGGSGTSTLSGPILVQNGTLQFADSDNRLPAASVITLGSGTNTAVVDLNGTNQTVASLTVAAGATAANVSVINSSGNAKNLTVSNSAAAVTYTGHLTGSTLNIVKAGTNDFTVSGSAGNTPNSWQINGGRLFFDGQTGLGSGPVTINSGGTLDYAGAALTLTNAVTINSGGNIASRTAPLTVSNATLPTAGTLIINQDTQATSTVILNTSAPTTLTGALAIQVGGGAGAPGLAQLNGIISGSAALTKTQTGTLFLNNAANDFSSVLTISAGTVRVAANGALGTTGGGTVVSSGATLEFNGTNGAFNYSTAEPIAINGSGVGGVGAINQVGGDNILAAPITLQTSATIGSATATKKLTINGSIAMAGISNISFTGAGNIDVVNSFGNGNSPIVNMNALVQNWYDTAGVARDESFIANMGVITSGANGGLIARTPIKGSNLTNSALSFADINPFNAAASSPTTGTAGIPGDDFAFLWTGNFTAVIGGQYTFGVGNTSNGVDDEMAILIDINDDGLFDNATENFATTVGTGCCGNGTAIPRTFTAGEIHKIAIGFHEWTGGEKASASFKITGDPTFGSDTAITPGAANQAGFWSYVSQPNNGVIMSGTGVVTLLGQNTYNGTTTINSGTLVAGNAADNTGGLGTSTTAIPIASGATLGLANGAHISGRNITVDGTGAAGQPGAIANISGTNSYTGTITAALVSAGSIGIGSTLGTLTLNGAINLQYSKITFGGADATIVNSTISGVGVSAITSNILGQQWYDIAGVARDENLLNNMGVTPTNGGLLTRTPIKGSNVTTNALSFANLAAFNSAASPASTGTTGVPGDDFAFLWTGRFTATIAGQYTFSVGTLSGGVDDEATILIDLNDDGIFDNATERVSSTIGIGCCGSSTGTARTFALNETHRVAMAFHEQAGGEQASFAFRIAGHPTLGTDTAINPGSAAQAGMWSTAIIADNSLVKTGTGAVTLTAANTYQGNTTVTQGTLNTSIAEALGTNPASTLTVSGAGTVLNLFDNSSSTTTFGTVDLSAGTGTVNTFAGKLAIKNQLKLIDSYTVAGNFTAEGANLVDNAVQRTLSAVTGAMTVTKPANPSVISIANSIANTYVAAANPTTAAYTVNSGVSVLIVEIGTKNANAATLPTSVTWNGLALTRAINAPGNLGTFRSSSIWYRFNPNTSGSPVSAPIILSGDGGSTNTWTSAFTLSGVDTTKNPDTTTTYTGFAANDAINNYVNGVITGGVNSGRATGVTLANIPAASWIVTAEIGNANPDTFTWTTSGASVGTAVTMANTNEDPNSTVFTRGAFQGVAATGSYTINASATQNYGKSALAVAAFAPAAGAPSAISLLATNIKLAADTSLVNNAGAATFGNLIVAGNSSIAAGATVPTTVSFANVQGAATGTLTVSSGPTPVISGTAKAATGTTLTLQSLSYSSNPVVVGDTGANTGTVVFGGTTTLPSSGVVSVAGGTASVGTGGTLGGSIAAVSGSTVSSGSVANVTGGLTSTGATVTPGGAGTIGALALGGTLSADVNSTFNFDYLNAGSFDTITANALNLSGNATVNLTGSGFVASPTPYTLISYGSRVDDGTKSFTLIAPTGLPFSFTPMTTATGFQVLITSIITTLIWDAPAGTAPDDGAGDWDNDSTNFYAGAPGFRYGDNTGNDLIIGSGGSGGTITLTGNVTTGGNLTFATVTSPYTISGTNSLTTVGGIVVNNSATINAPIVLGAAQAWLVASGQTLTAGGAITQLNSNTGLTKSGAGTLTLNSAASYTGGTSITAGALKIGSVNGVLPSAGAVSLANATGALLDLDGHSQTIGSLSGGGGLGGNVNLGAATLTVGDSSTTTYSGVIGGTGGLTKQGGGTLILSASQAYTGDTNIENGAITAAAAQTFVAFATSNHVVNIKAGGTLNVTAAGALSGVVINIYSGGTLNPTIAGALNGAIINILSGATFAPTLTDSLTGTTINVNATGTFNAGVVLSGAAVNIDGTANASVAGALTNSTVIVNSGGTLSATAAGAVTGSTVTLNTGSNALNVATVDSLSGATINVAGGTLALGANSTTVAGVSLQSGSITGAAGLLNSSTPYDVRSGSISAILSGSVALNKTTNGVVTLTRVNTYTGATNVNAGTLTVSGSTAASSTVNIADGGTLDGTGTVNGNATLTGTGIVNFTNPGKISGTLAVTGGHWNGAGSVTGQISVTSGTFTVASGAALTANTGISVTSSALDLTGATLYLGSSGLTGTSATVNLDGGVIQALTSTTISVPAILSNSIGSQTIDTNGFTLTVSGALTGGGILTKIGAGTLNLTSASSSYGGGTIINAGTVAAFTTSSLGVGTVTQAGGQLNAVAGTYTNNVVIPAGATTTTSTVTTGANSVATFGTLTQGAGATLNVNGAISAVSGFGGNGTGWTLNGGPTVVADIATLTTNAGNQARSLWNNQAVTIASGFQVNYTYTDVTVGGADGMAFVLQNAGLTAVGAAGGGLGYQNITPSFAVQFNIYAPNTVGYAFRTNGAVSTPFTSTGSVNIDSGVPVNVQLNYSGTTLTMTLTQGSNTFSANTTIDLGALLGAQSYIGFTGGTGGVSAAQTIGNFSFTNSTASSYGLAFGQTNLTTSATVNVVNATFGPGNLALGTLNDGGAALTLNKSGNGTLTLGAAATSLVAGAAVNVNGGSLASNNATALGNSASVALAGSTTFSLGASQTVGSLTGTGGVSLNGSELTVANDSPAVFDGIIANGTSSGSLVKSGSSILTLSNASTFIGGTTVSGGTLLVNGSLASTVIVTGGTLGGGGSVNAAVNVNAGGTLAPGASIGTLNIGNTLTLAGTSSFEVTPGSGPLGSADKVTGVFALTYGGTLKVSPNPSGAYALGDSWDLFDFTSESGTFSNTFGNGDGTNLPLLGSGLGWQFNYSTGILSVVATIAAPTVTSIVPAIGPTTGGTMLLINGSNFVSITTVTIAGSPLASFSVSGTTQISVTTPSHAAGGVDVVVTNAGGSGSLAGASDFTYAAPAVASVVVNGGPGVFLGGSSWSLAGQNSVVKQILVTFNQAVSVASDAFTVTPVPVSVNPGPGVVVVNGGATPSSNAATTSVTMLTASTYLVTFVDDSGDITPSTHAGGILNSGVYDLTIIASKVTANTEPLAGNHKTTFFAMFGTINANDSFTTGTIGDGFSNAFVDPGSLFQFSDAFGSNAATPAGPPAYNIVFDSNLDGFIDPGDLFAFSDAFGIDWDF